MHKLASIGTGLAGIGGVELTNQLIQVSPTVVGDYGKLLVEIAIGIVTLWGLIKRGKKKSGAV